MTPTFELAVAEFWPRLQRYSNALNHYLAAKHEYEVWHKTYGDWRDVVMEPLNAAEARRYDPRRYSLAPPRDE